MMILFKFYKPANALLLRLIFPSFGFLLLVVSCESRVDKKEPTAQLVVDNGINFSGGKLFVESEVKFDFRNISYSSVHGKAGRIYSRRIHKMDSVIVDSLIGAELLRYVNGHRVVVTDSLKQLFANALNSVHYFARLPYGLNDKAVKKQYLGKDTIAGTPCYKIQVSFAPEGGGVDHQDVFVYWFDQENFSLPFMAYSYETDGGGYRFRAAKNPRRVGGILFQDYENYKPTYQKVELVDMGELYTRGELELLSEINIENISVQDH